MLAADLLAETSEGSWCTNETETESETPQRVGRGSASKRTKGGVVGSRSGGTVAAPSFKVDPKNLVPAFHERSTGSSSGGNRPYVSRTSSTSSSSLPSGSRGSPNHLAVGGISRPPVSLESRPSSRSSRQPRSARSRRSRSTRSRGASRRTSLAGGNQASSTDAQSSAVRRLERSGSLPSLPGLVRPSDKESKDGARDGDLRPSSRSSRRSSAAGSRRPSIGRSHRVSLVTKKPAGRGGSGAGLDRSGSAPGLPGQLHATTGKAGRRGGRRGPAEPIRSQSLLLREDEPGQGVAVMDSVAELSLTSQRMVVRPCGLSLLLPLLLLLLLLLLFLYCPSSFLGTYWELTGAVLTLYFILFLLPTSNAGAGNYGGGV